MTIYTIYKATNRTNNKIYIGFDSNWPRRKYIHEYITKTGKYKPSALHNAMKKYGIDAFEWEVLYQSKDQDFCLNIMEAYFIRLYNTTDRNFGYNITPGGQGYSHSEDIKQIIREKTSGKNHYNYGKVTPDEVKDKIRNANSGAKNGFFGRKHSEETKRKISETKKRNLL